MICPIRLQNYSFILKNIEGMERGKGGRKDPKITIRDSAK